MRSGVVVRPAAKSGKASRAAMKRITRPMALRSLYRQMAAIAYKRVLSAELSRAGRHKVRAALRRLGAYETAAVDGADLADIDGADAYGLTYAPEAGPAEDASQTPMDEKLAQLDRYLDRQSEMIALAASDSQMPESVRQAFKSKAALLAELHYELARIFELLADAATRAPLPPTPLGPDGLPDLQRTPSAAVFQKMAARLSSEQGPLQVVRALPTGGVRSARISRAATLKKTYRLMAALDYRAALIAGASGDKARRINISLQRIHQAATRGGVKSGRGHHSRFDPYADQEPALDPPAAPESQGDLLCENLLAECPAQDPQESTFEYQTAV